MCLHAKSLVMYDSLHPYGLWFTRLFCPWNSLGKNIRIDFHALPPGDLPNPGIKTTSLMSPAMTGGFFTTSATWEAICCAVLYLVAQSCLTLCDPMDYSLLGSFVHGDSPDKNTGVGCHALPPGDLPDPGIES